MKAGYLIGTLGRAVRLLLGLLLLYLAFQPNGPWRLFITASPSNPPELPIAVGFAVWLLFVYFGASLLLAAIYRFSGCEVTAVPNLILRRRKHVFCPVLTSIDDLESRYQSRGSQKSTTIVEQRVNGALKKLNPKGKGGGLSLVCHDDIRPCRGRRISQTL